MNGYLINIEKETLANENFRNVLFTSQHCQLVLMSLNPNEEIGIEVHEIVDQFIRIEQGSAKAIINNEEHSLSDGDVIIVPAGSKHNIINTSPQNKLKLYTIYSPAHHKDKTVHKTKKDALKDKEDFI